MKGAKTDHDRLLEEMCYLLEVQAGQEIPEIKEYIVLISYLYAQLCLPNVSAMSYKICRNINIQRNVKYRPVEKTWHIVFIQTCFHEIVSTAFTDFSRGGKRIKDILYIVLHRTWSIYSILSTDLCSFWSSDAGKSVAEASTRALHVVLQTPTQIS